MKLHLKIFLILSTCIFAITSNAGPNEGIPLWGSTYYDMTMDEVLHNIAGAKRLENTDSSTTDKVSKDLVKLEDVVISDEKFNVLLMFKNNLLKEVQLNWVPNSLKINTDLYANLSWLLSLKYGQPVKSTHQDFGPPSTSWQAQWVKNMMNIDLFSDKKYLQIKYTNQYLNDLKNL